jgi:dihydrophenazinedicarboxylate synthase
MAAQAQAQAQTLSGDTSLVLPEFDTPPQDPYPLLRQWMANAVDQGIREPYAAVLATADRSGRASSRVLLVKEFDDRGLQFTSFMGSRKGRDLAVMPWASLTFYWRETLQQLSVEGPVEVLTGEESDALFARRPIAAQATTAVSRQSRALDDESGLKARAKALAEKGDPLARPDDWTGYRLVPEAVEFWYGSPDRLHRRLRYDREAGTAPWTHQRLQP